jgi:C4-dicarboxylate-specific signal transduction histidine kinase
MTESSAGSTTGDAATKSADVLIRRLAVRYFLVLAAVALLVVADQAIVQPLLGRMDAYAPVINVAGRQRMLSQRIAKAALAIEVTAQQSVKASRREELRGALGQWAAAHRALRFGDAELGLLSIRSPAIDHKWSQLKPHFGAMLAAARQLLDDSPSGRDAEADSHAVAILVAHEPLFLATMDETVKLFEDESTAELRRLQVYALMIAATIVTLLIGLGWFVVRPATRTIRAQVDGLEAQVTLRTRELADALSALRREVHEREQVESRNRRLAVQLAHADRVESMGRLAVGLAHELNQPLGAIANYASACDVVASRPLDPRGRGQLREYVARVKDSALRAGQIVRRMRNFVRPDPGAMADVDMTGLVHEVVELCRAEAVRGDVELQIEDPGEPAVVSADSIQLQQVLVNLMQNAMQAMQRCPPDGRRLTIRMTPRGESVQIDVIDSGPGLTGADPEAIFTPFHTTKEEGLGVGLSICRSIVEHHQGTIWARSPASGGAQFSFTLPLAAQHVAERIEQADCVCR